MRAPAGLAAAPIDARLLAPESLQQLRALFAAGSPRALFVPGALDLEAIHALRELAAQAVWSSQQIADRGSYQAAELAAELASELAPKSAAALVSALVDFAGLVTGLSLRPGPASLRRLRSGDYSLMKDDARARPAHLAVELLVDLSEAPTGEAEVTYTDGAAAYVVVPQQPGSLAILERSTRLHRHERYLTHRVGDRRVERLYVALVASGDASQHG